MTLSTEQKVENFVEQIREDPDNQINIKSQSFWNKFGVKHRTEKTSQMVTSLFKNRGVLISVLGAKLGTEQKDAVIKLRYWHIPTPDEDWFNKIAEQRFESESEVTAFFLIPLFLRLGYFEEDMALEYSLIDSNKSEKYRADCVLFDCGDVSLRKELVLVEAKKPADDEKENAKRISAAVNDLKAYSNKGFPFRRWVATNGHKIHIFASPLSVNWTPELIVDRAFMKNEWASIYLMLGKLVVKQESGL